MSASTAQLPTTPRLDASLSALPVVVVGAGPIGARFVRELRQRAPNVPIVLYGREAHLPYNRVKLSSWLAGDVPHDDLLTPLPNAPEDELDTRFGCAIVDIDREAKTVTDELGRRTTYRALVLSTGSTPHVPTIPGTALPGVFTLRDYDDATHLMARQARSRSTVVLGGGLLGLEAARAMQRLNTQVTVVEHESLLMYQQLDEVAATMLANRVNGLGINIRTSDAVREVLGEDRVTGVRLRSGDVLPCDTLVIATGIRPQTELAIKARLSVDRGIRVNDYMRTSDPHVFALGECAQHDGKVHGLVAPGLEQAAVAAATIAGQQARYVGSITAAELKVATCAVFSMGSVGEGHIPRSASVHRFQGDAPGQYRMLVTMRRHLIGAIAIGPWAETRRLRIAIERNQLLWPWQLFQFERTGEIWPGAEAENVAAWPKDTTVCQCMGINRGAISTAISSGATSVEAVSNATMAGTVCGSCRTLVRELVGDAAPVAPLPMHKALGVFAAMSIVIAVSMLVAPTIPYPDSVQVEVRWDLLWRDETAKQFSGYSAIGLFIASLVLSPRKRVKKLERAGNYDKWRLAHLITGSLAALVLAVHTGLSVGHGLNFMLVTCTALLLLAGGLTSGVLAFEHRLSATVARQWRKHSFWLHLIAFWPVPVLLGFHIFKTYWF